MIGQGGREGKLLLVSVTSVGHSSSEGKPITLKGKMVGLFHPQNIRNTVVITNFYLGRNDGERY